MSNSIEHVLDDDMEVEFTGKCQGHDGFGSIDDALANSDHGTVMHSPLSESEAEQLEPEPEPELEHEREPEPGIEQELEQEPELESKPKIQSETEPEHEQEQQHQELVTSPPEHDREVNKEEKHDEEATTEDLQENQTSLETQESKISESDASASPDVEPMQYQQQSTQADVQHICLLIAASVFLLCWLFFHVVMIVLLISVMVTPKIFHGVCAVVDVASWIHLFICHQLGFA